ncbi:sensor histidine kinase [Lacisediminihabitans changchengi]|nr:HAMP domain-containing sensor histidine kinase [Lacisediminihabitans changchengi]
MLTVVYLAMTYLPKYSFPQTAVTSTTLVPAGQPISVQSAKPLTAGIVVSSTSDLLSTLLMISVVSLILLVAVGAAASWVLIGRMLRPLTALTDAATLARQGSLSHRVNSVGRDDELHRLSRSFDEMLEQLERSFSAQQRFAANASHEIRTPLATTKALLDVAREGQHSAETTLLLDRLSSMNQRTILITNAMLDLATIGEHSLDVAEVDIHTEVTQQLQDLDDELREKDIRVTTDLHPARLHGDPTLLKLMVGNLMRNAIRHNVQGGDVVVSTVSVDGFVELTISNSGEQVPEETIELLREPFYRQYGRVQSTDRHSGRGLGLALAASIVDAHRGKIALRPRAGGGLEVDVSLPV